MNKQYNKLLVFFFVRTCYISGIAVVKIIFVAVK